MSGNAQLSLLIGLSCLSEEKVSRYKVTRFDHRILIFAVAYLHFNICRLY